jgi:flagellar motor switch/type III secretory pathway protein FliN
MVSVRVEIATAMMTAREWASLGPGAVVQLGQRVGNPVTIRVGGIAIASGELIDIDGEVGVRILSRTSEAASP